MGLEMAGPEWTQVLRNLAVGRTGLSKMAASLWLNADALTRTADYATVLVGFVDYQRDGFARPRKPASRSPVTQSPRHPVTLS